MYKQKRRNAVLLRRQRSLLKSLKSRILETTTTTPINRLATLATIRLVPVKVGPLWDKANPPITTLVPQIVLHQQALQVLMAQKRYGCFHAFILATYSYFYNRFDLALPRSFLRPIPTSTSPLVPNDKLKF